MILMMMVVTSELVYIGLENTMLVSFDIKFIRRDQKQHRTGEACRASPKCFWSSLINLISKDTYVVFYLSCIICRFNGENTHTHTHTHTKKKKGTK